MEITKEEMNAIISLAQKMIIKLEENKMNTHIRESEDVIDWDSIRTPEKCEDCND